MKTIYLAMPNDKRIKNNSIFDTKIDINFSIFATLKEYFYQNGIVIKTIDMGTPNKKDTLLFFDTPYPWNRAAWKILSQSYANKILIAFEPPIVNPFNYLKHFNARFDRILTWNDELIDNKKFFKYNWPQSNNKLKTKAIPFKKKKLLTLINGNKLPFAPFRPFSGKGKELYSERINAISYFEEHIPSEFDLYGVGWNQPKKYNLSERLFGFRKYKVYKGRIDDKIDVLSNYKFCLCFENLTDVNGYFTEKIFDAFKARSVPIYWGAKNIDKYIPKGCYIDFREFNSYPLLIKYLKNMNEKKYNEYIKNIEKLLNNKVFLKSWFEVGFAKSLFKLIV